MASPILHPRLGAAVGEGDGDEGRAGVVEADGTPGGAPLEELGARDAGGAQVLAEASRAGFGDGTAKLVGEDGIIVGEPAAGDGLAEGVPGARAATTPGERAQARGSSVLFSSSVTAPRSRSTSRQVRAMASLGREPSRCR